MQNINLYIEISLEDLHTFLSHLVQSLLEALYPGKIYSKDSEKRKNNCMKPRLLLIHKAYKLHQQSTVQILTN